MLDYLVTQVVCILFSVNKYYICFYKLNITFWVIFMQFSEMEQTVKNVSCTTVHDPVVYLWL